MRLYIRLTKNTEIIPFAYQELLTSCIHRWLGKDNKEHGSVSLYSFSWLQNVKATKQGIWLKSDSYFTINFYDESQVKKIIKSILSSPGMFNGSRVSDIQIEQTPVFSEKERFILSSPVLIKRYDGDKDTHYTFEDEKSDEYLTETMKTKVKTANSDFGDFKIYFDKSYTSPKTKIVEYKGIKNRVNLCPVIIEGTPELIAFAWDVGIGNSTGIGFGALK